MSSDDPINFESVRTYAELVGVGIFVVFGTAFYVQWDGSIFARPMVILLCSILLGVYTILREESPRDSKPSLVKNNGLFSLPKRPEAVTAGWMWLLWLVYSSVFRDVAFQFDSFFWSVVQTGTASAVVVVSYFLHYNSMHVAYLAALSAVLLFVPHLDALASSTPPAYVYIKVAESYVLYSLHEIIQIMEDDFAMRMTNAASPPIGKLHAAELKALRSGWILFAYRYFVYAAVFQIVYVSYALYRYVEGRTPAAGWSGKRPRKTTETPILPERDPTPPRREEYRPSPPPPSSPQHRSAPPSPATTQGALVHTGFDQSKVVKVDIEAMKRLASERGGAGGGWKSTHR
jgi:hypothetical protein